MAARHNRNNSSAPSSGFRLGKYFRRAPSQSPAASASRPVGPVADQKVSAAAPLVHFELQSQSLKRQMQRSAVFGSCAQSVGTVASVLFTTINHSGHYDETARDSTVTRQAKILYVSLLESVQKERGEWQGFSSSSGDSTNNNGPEDTEAQTPHELLTSSIAAKSAADQLGVLNELMEVSFRNLMGPLVPVELYTRHKKVLLRESLAVPPALTTLLAIRGVLDRLEREVRHCLLRLLSLWDLVAIVGGDSQPLLKTIADKHHHVFSESSEFESRTARKSERQDAVAIDLLQIMVLYRDILFSDIEFILTRQELQINQGLMDEARAKAWPLELEPAALSEEDDDRFSSGADVSSEDENQVQHDDAAFGMPWGRDSAVESLALRSLTSSSMPSRREEERDGVYYYDEDEEGEWSIPSPARYGHHQHRKTQRHHSMEAPPVSGGPGPLVPVPLVPTSSDGVPPPRKEDLSTLVPGGHRHSQRSPDSPTHSAISQASSSTRSSSRRLQLRTKQRSSSSMNGNGRSDLQRHENHWHDSASSESRSPPPPSRSTVRRHNSKRVRGSKSASGRRRRSSAQSADQAVQDNARQPAHNEIRAKPAADSSFLSVVVSTLTIPVAAATLCVLATMATLAIYEMRKAPRN